MESDVHTNTIDSVFTRIQRRTDFLAKQPVSHLETFKIFGPFGWNLPTLPLTIKRYSFVQQVVGKRDYGSL